MFYSVHRGKEKGIFNTWNECKLQIDGYKNPKFKKFDNIDEAKYFMEHGETYKVQHISIPHGYNKVWTDGSCKVKENESVNIDLAKSDSDMNNFFNANWC